MKNDTTTETDQNFSRVAKLLDNKGNVDLDTEPQIEMTEDEKIDFVAARILCEHRAAFEELAK